MTSSEDDFVDACGQRARWVVGYEQTISRASNGSTLRVNLSHGFSFNRVYRESLVNICWYTPQDTVSDAAISFRTKELLFLKEKISMALSQRGKIRAKMPHGDRMITVRSDTMIDREYVVPACGDVIDGYHYKSIVILGYRHEDDSNKFTIDFSAGL